MPGRKLRIAIVAGETSGDILGAGLMQAIMVKYPNVEFEGIAGPRMLAEDCKSLYPMERLSVTGLTEVLGRLRELLAMRKSLAKRFIQHPPDLFIGIDAPDFNLGLERRLKQAGIPVVHYVSPSVWAWRQYRIHKIVKSADLMLTLFPFETDIYAHHGMAAEFVGHPMADDIDLRIEAGKVRERLGLASERKLIALLPGSRVNEVRRLGPAMLETAAWCWQRDDSIQFVAPMATAEARRLFEAQLAELSDKLPVTLFDGQAREVMQAADSILLASGTATLEAMLLKKPMVVCYKLSSFSHWLMRRLARVKYISLPNLLAGQGLVPEFIQQDATAENMGRQLLSYLQDREQHQSMILAFTDIHRTLRKNASQQAASHALKLIDR